MLSQSERSVRRAAGRVSSGSASRQRENALPMARPFLCHKPLALVHPMGRLSGKETAMSIRPVKRLIKSKPTTEGAGVDLISLFTGRSEEHTSELQSQSNLVCRLLLEKKKKIKKK